MVWTLGRNTCQQTSTLKLIFNKRIDLLLCQSCFLFFDHSVARLHWFFVFLFLILAFLPKGHTIPFQVILLEWLSINLHNAVLHEGFGANQLVACGIVDDVQNTNFFCTVLRRPRKISMVQTQCAIFHVPSTTTHWMDSLESYFAERSWSAHFILSFFLVDVASTTSFSVFVP